MGWYGVRHVVKWGEDDEKHSIYEERVTLWKAESFEDAISRAETEADEYATEILDEGEVLDLFQAYLVGETPAKAASASAAVASDLRNTGLLLEDEFGAEVFSLIRHSDLSARDYIDRF